MRLKIILGVGMLKVGMLVGSGDLPRVVLNNIGLFVVHRFCNIRLLLSLCSILHIKLEITYEKIVI